jgi:FMN phosphatase YigB (HAD superfamily)
VVVFLPRTGGIGETQRLPAAELLFFDDHLPNVLAARAAGWQAVHFTGVAAAEQALRERGLWSQT